MIPRVVIYRLYFFLKRIGPSVERASSLWNGKEERKEDLAQAQSSQHLSKR